MIRLLSRIRGNLRRSSERGQILLFFALGIVPLTFVLGVVATDVTIWQSERRGAQKDADFSALAGAYALLDATPVAANAIAAAQQYSDTNDEAGNAQIIGAPVVDNSCFPADGRLDSVIVDVDHDSRTFFADFFGISVPEVGAHARACVGSIVSRRGLRPYAIEISHDSCFSGGLPIYGEPGCILDDGSLSTSTADRGLIDLNTSGPCSNHQGNLIRDQVMNGADTACTVGDPIYQQTGGQSGNDLEGIQELLAGNGSPAVFDGEICDAAAGVGNNDGEDDWLEVLQPVPNTTPQLYAPRGCETPRLIDIVIIDQFAGVPSQPADMLGIASMYILGCKQPAEPYSIITSDDAHQTCWAFDKPNTPGQVELWGIFFQKLDSQGDIGEYNELSGLGIRLRE